MSRVDVRLLTAGMASLTDLGRPGLAHLGISLNGAADGYAARVANVLVGNRDRACLVEVTGSAFACVASGPVLLAVTGAADRVLVDGTPQPAWESLVVAPGRRVEIEAPRVGLRSYLALRGRLVADVVLGSVAPDGLLGIGRRLRAGDGVVLHTPFVGLDHPATRVPVFRFGIRPPDRSRPLLVHTTPGPDAAEFRGEALEATYEVSPQSDHVGLRLHGPTPRRTTSTEILSRGVPVGAIEVPPSGGLLVLLRGRLLTAGYPVLAVATADAVERLGQVRPGDAVRFHSVDLARARADGQRSRAELAALRTRVRTAFAAVGVAHDG